MKKVLHFIKYNNLFTLILMFTMLGSGVSLAASPTVRDSLISTKDVVASIDNSYIIAANLERYDFKLKITGITEDPSSYFVSYSYQTIDLVDYAWQDVTYQKTLHVSKAALAGGDLGLFVSQQLGQITDSQLVYLKDVQRIEKEKGTSHKVISTQYAGLIGRMFSSREKTFAGYAPVIPPVDPDSEKKDEEFQGPVESESERSKSIPAGLKIKEEKQEDLIQKMVEDLLNTMEDATPSEATSTDPVIEEPIDPEEDVVIPPDDTTPDEPAPPESPATSTDPVVPEPVATSTEPVTSDPEPEPEPAETPSEPTPPATPPAETPVTETTPPAPEPQVPSQP